MTLASEMYLIHGIGMWVAWGLLGLMQMVSNRYMKHHWTVAMWLHRISAGLIWSITVGMSFLAFDSESWSLKKGIHPLMGVGILATVTLPILGGLFARSKIQNSRWNTAGSLKIKLGH